MDMVERWNSSFERQVFVLFFFVRGKIWFFLQRWVRWIGSYCKRFSMWYFELVVPRHVDCSSGMEKLYMHAVDLKGSSDIGMMGDKKLVEVEIVDSSRWIGGVSKGENRMEITWIFWRNAAGIIFVVVVTRWLVCNSCGSFLRRVQKNFLFFPIFCSSIFEPNLDPFSRILRQISTKNTLTCTRASGKFVYNASFSLMTTSG